MQICQSLAQTWRKDRAEFFIEFARFLSVNFSAEELQIFFNDLDDAQSDKEKLSLSVITGRKVFSQSQAKLEEVQFFQQYTKNVGALNIERPNSDEINCAFRIQTGPCLVMFKAQEINELQLSLLHGLVSGIQTLLKK